MFLLLRTTLCCILFIIICSCKKQEGIIDNYTDPPDQITTLKTTVSAAGREFLEIQWNKVEHSHFEEVSYAVYLEGEKIVDKLSSTKYSLINLEPGKKYNIKVIASTNNGKQVEQIVEGSTLPALKESEKVYLQQYSFHDFSLLLGPTGLIKLEDGGHLVVRELAHPTDFTHVHYKIIVFRVDKYGQMLWYRLLAFEDFNLPVDSAVFQLTTIKGDQEAILFAGNQALKFAVSNGEVLLKKTYEDLLPEQIILSVKKVSFQEIIAATDDANLISVSPEDLRIIWHKNNQGQSGTLESIQVDSKQNVYAIFNDRNEKDTPIKVNKYDPKGKFLNSFQFDGRLEGEYNWGFVMNALLVDPQDNLYLFGYNASFSYTRYFKFKADGTLIKKNELSENLLIRGAHFNAKGEIVANGQVDGSGRNTWGGIFVFDKDMNIKTRQIWTSLPPHSLSGITSNADGTYNLFASFLPVNSQYDGFMYIKTALDGKI
jgi:hypothetical protein